MTDEFKTRSPKEVAEFLRHLAFATEQGLGRKSLAAEMLLHWLNGNGCKKVFSSDFLKDVPLIDRYLMNEVRPVFLTQKKAVLIGHRIWGGIVARIKGIMPTDGKPQLPDGRWPINYEGSSIEMPMIDAAKLRLGIKIDEREQDLFHALHGFGLATEVVMAAEPLGFEKYEVRFDRWLTRAIDRYHWNPGRRIVLPNPDFGSRDRSAIAPGQPVITFHYRHAIRVEQAGLAHPFESESTEWTPSDPRITARAVIDTSRYFVTADGLEYRQQ